MTYDSHEAKQALSDAMSGLPGHLRTMRSNALPALLQALQQLSGPGVTIRPHPHNYDQTVLQMFVGDTLHATIEADLNEGAVYIGAGETRTKVDLVFNYTTTIFEGRTVDPSVEPAPGARRPRRSALAVIVEAALAARPKV